MPSELTPVLRKVHDAWAKLKAAWRAKVRADGAKSDADGKYVQKVKEMAEAAVSGLTQAQKARFDDQINALTAKKVKADNDVDVIVQRWQDQTRETAKRGHRPQLR